MSSQRWVNALADIRRVTAPRSSNFNTSNWPQSNIPEKMAFHASQRQYVHTLECMAALANLHLIDYYAWAQANNLRPWEEGPRIEAHFGGDAESVRYYYSALQTMRKVQRLSGNCLGMLYTDWDAIHNFENQLRAAPGMYGVSIQTFPFPGGFAQFELNCLSVLFAEPRRKIVKYGEELAKLRLEYFRSMNYLEPDIREKFHGMGVMAEILDRNEQYAHFSNASHHDARVQLEAWRLYEYGRIQDGSCVVGP